MLFVVSCTDKANSGPLRAQNREAHLAYLASQGDRLKAAGPYLNAVGTAPAGSLLIIEAEDIDAARKFSEADPYAVAGVFGQVDIRPWRWLIGNPSAEG